MRMFSVYNNDSTSLWNTPNILTQKLPAEEFTATVKVSFKAKFNNERFGLVVLGSDYGYISLRKTELGLQISYCENNKADKNGKEKELASFPASGNDYYLSVKMEKEGIYQFSYSRDGVNFETTVPSFTARPGRWVGATLGLFCSRNNVTNDAGYADVDWFRITHN